MQSSKKIARRDKKAFISDQCKEIEENNRLGKTRDLLKKTGDIKAKFHASMDTIKIMAFDPITSWQIQGEKVEVVQILFGGAPKSLWTVTIAIILKDTCSF